METVSMIPRFRDAREIARNCAEASLDEAATQTLLDLAQLCRLAEITSRWQIRW